MRRFHILPKVPRMITPSHTPSHLTMSLKATSQDITAHEVGDHPATMPTLGAMRPITGKQKMRGQLQQKTSSLTSWRYLRAWTVIMTSWSWMGIDIWYHA